MKVGRAVRIEQHGVRVDGAWLRRAVSVDTVRLGSCLVGHRLSQAGVASGQFDVELGCTVVVGPYY
jgi:hypothetical protein